MSNKQLLALDAYQVLFAWCNGFIGYCINRGFVLDLNSDFDTYNMSSWFVNMSDEQFKALIVDYNDHEHPKLFGYLVDTLPKLLNKYNICVVTAYTNCPEAAKKRKGILVSLGITDVFMVALGESKLEVLQEIGPDLFVDDSPKHILEGLEAGCKTYAISYPYNQGIDGVIYIKSLEELL